MITHKSVYDVPLKEIERGVLVTGFRPSTSHGLEESIGLTLGHMEQIEKVKYLQEQGCKDIYVIIADVQGAADKISPQHIKLISQITMDYAHGLFASLGEEIIVVRESKLRREFAYLTDLLQDHMELHDLGIQDDQQAGEFFRHRSTRLTSKGKIPTMSNILTSLTGQSAHLISVGATLVPSGADQFKKTELTCHVIKRINQKFGLSIPQPAAIGSDSMLLGIDGEKMSSNSGNYISTKDTIGSINTKVDQMEPETLSYYYKKFLPNNQEDQNKKKDSLKKILFQRVESMKTEASDDVILRRLSAGEQIYLQKINKVIGDISPFS